LSDHVAGECSTLRVRRATPTTCEIDPSSFSSSASKAGCQLRRAVGHLDLRLLNGQSDVYAIQT